MIKNTKPNKDTNKETTVITTTAPTKETGMTTISETEITTTKSTTTTIKTTTKPVTTKQTTTTEKIVTTYKAPATENVTTETSGGDIQWVEFNCSAYCTCTICTGGGGITASGTIPQANWTIAASKNYPFGTLIYIDGYGTYCVEDRGGAITNNKLDLYFATHQEACNFGRRYLKGYVVRWGYGK